MANNYHNINIGNYSPANANIGGNYGYSTEPQSDNLQNPDEFYDENRFWDAGYNENPSHSRLNALDSTLLEAEAYQNMDDEVFKIEYKINRLEEGIKSIDKEIENAKRINDFQKADVLLMRRHAMESELESLNASYDSSDVTTKLSSEITSILSAKPTLISKTLGACKEFISEKFLPKISKNFNSGKNIKDALTKLETLNKNVDELVTMQTPYGEADERYDKLSEYLNRANVIHFQISKTVGTPTFFDTISSIDKEKFTKTQNKSNFNNMAGRPKP